MLMVDATRALDTARNLGLVSFKKAFVQGQSYTHTDLSRCLYK